MSKSSPKLKNLVRSFRALQGLDLARVVAEPATHDALLAWTRAQVASGGRLGGQAWAGYESEPRYAAYKAALGAPLQPLRWTRGEERLVPALTQPGHPDHLWTTTPKGAALNLAIPYLSDLERGGRNQFGEPQPARPIFNTRSGDLPRSVIKAVAGTFYRRVAELGLPLAQR